MAIKKIPCGGFRYDDETVEFTNGVMKAKGGGDIPEEVTNAIETHGMGWTSESVGFDINRETSAESDLYYGGRQYAKCSNETYDATDFIGSIIYAAMNNPYYIEDEFEVVDEMIHVADNGLIEILPSGDGFQSPGVLCAPNDIEEEGIAKGIYMTLPYMGWGVHRIYKESKEVVHQIDQKYITDAPVVVHFTIGEQGLKWDKWYDELLYITDRPIEGILTVDNGGVYNAQYDPMLKKFYIKTLEITDDGTPIENITAYIKAVAWDYGSPRWEFVEVTPSSGGRMVVNVIGTVINNQVVLSGDKTYNEIWDAVKSGTSVTAIAQLGEEIPFIAPLVHVAGPNYAEVAYFGLTWLDAETGDLVSALTVNSADEWSVYNP